MNDNDVYDIDPFDYDFSFFTFYHICPKCGKLVDDGSSDGICFDCLEELGDSCS